jgi:hypothetical protein
MRGEARMKVLRRRRGDWEKDEE